MTRQKSHAFDTEKVGRYKNTVEANNSKSANHLTVKSKDSFYFHTSSLPVEPNHSKSVEFVQDNSTVESCSFGL